MTLVVYTPKHYDPTCCACSNATEELDTNFVADLNNYLQGTLWTIFPFFCEPLRPVRGKVGCPFQLLLAPALDLHSCHVYAEDTSFEQVGSLYKDEHVRRQTPSD